MYSYRLRLGDCAHAPASHSLLSILNVCLNRLRLHTEVTFWEFDQVVHCFILYNLSPRILLHLLLLRHPAFNTSRVIATTEPATPCLSNIMQS